MVNAQMADTTALKKSGIGIDIDPDSIEVSLNEVTVEAAQVIRKGNKDLYMPSATSKELATDGLSLLNNMQLPGMGINSMLKTITVNGQTPELRINNRRATLDNVMALNPESVVRVELITDPGVRYGNASTVVNVIVRNPATGGYAYADVLQGLGKDFGNYSGSVSLNFGKSQIEYGTSWQVRKNMEVYRDNHELYRLPDGTELERYETTDYGRLGYNYGWNNLAYSYSDPDKMNIYTAINLNRCMDAKNYYRGKLYSYGRSGAIAMEEYSDNPFTRPGMHLYLDRSLGRKQTLVLDADANLMRSSSQRRYNETAEEETVPATDIINMVRDHNFNLSSELTYIKEWDKAEFTAGGGYRMSRNRSTYKSNGGNIYHQRTDLGYVYAEYMRRFGAVSVTVGCSGEYWNTNYVENGNRLSAVKFSPDVSVQWRMNDAGRWRVRFNSGTSTPSLTESTPVYQAIDRYQGQIGNPDLKPYNSYNVNLTYSFSSGIASGDVTGFWKRSPHAIMEYSRYEDDMILNSWDNMSGYTSVGVRLSPRVNVIPGWFTVNGSVSFSHQAVRGLGYHHIHNSVAYNLTGQLTWRQFILSLTMYRGNEDLWGETLTRWESCNLAGLSYRYRHVSFNLGVIMPFGKYSMGTDKLSEVASATRINRTNMRIFGLGMTYNIDWGRKAKSVNRRTSTQADTQSSKAAGK